MIDESRTPPPAPPDAAVTRVRVRYFAGARAAAGTAEETLRLTPTGPSATVTDVITAVLAAHDDRLAHVLPACSFLINGVAARNHHTTVPDTAEFDVLPPFAGG